VVLQLALLALVGVAIVYDGSLPGLDVLTVVGVALAAAGAAIAVRASRDLGPAMTPHPDPRPGAALVDRGLYGVVRHPVYGAVVLIYAGASIAAGSRLGLIGSGVILGFLLVKIAYEERRLRMRYAGYRAYMDRVRHRLIPLLI
jgi:protein-S-isoprenylcysteine O-methyltransferase Ste14